jgi:iron-sulfur cluster repair protein YtfE (RIC family)
MSDSESITVKRIALDRPEDTAIPNASSLDALMQHIVTRHHGFLREELPVIERAIAKAVQLRAGTNATALLSLERTFRFVNCHLVLH